MKRNKYCPYKASCKNPCYADSPCELAQSFDRLGAWIERLKLEKHNLKAVNEKLLQDNETLKKQLAAATKVQNAASEA